MAGTTTYYGISYPTSTDYVKDGATAMQTIADGFDSVVAIPTYNNQTGTSYTFVLADAGKTVTSNNASAVTFTIPPQASVAWANNTTLTVRNLGAGVVTIAGGSGVTVTNTAQKVAQYGEVKLIRTASNAWTVVPASGSPSGLTFISRATISNQAAATFDNVFTTGYKNYLAIIEESYSSSYGNYLLMRFRYGATTQSSFTSSGQYSNAVGVFSNQGTTSNLGYGNQTAMALSNYTGISTQVLRGNILFQGVGNASEMPAYQSAVTVTGAGVQVYSATGGGMVNTADTYKGFELLSGAGNIWATVSIYGLAAS